MSASAAPATQSTAALPASAPPDVPLLPEKVTSMSPHATSAAQKGRQCNQAPRLPHTSDVDVTNCHACHTKYHGVTSVNADQGVPPEPVP